ncbi:hypothetical protein FA13DRAFT_1796793 [Coprinellus micaceus]|uniref:Fungal-type protein kinase domain-containing protein n=1 Tax=Coprinellus micaceus TaxID=71717 RepID=A0A4Y7ST16_COPMI|nr:hypothetical protein FA13DRAFT_1796793 [Coprinellus micaceus]
MATFDPITSLSNDWNAFLAAFSALFHCHATLWSVDIQHTGITQSNLMWDCGSAMPRLCDFDFSDEPGSLRPKPLKMGCLAGSPNAGKWIFMAAELLSLDAMDGLVKLVYRHEVEAFMAVLVWIICRYQDGKVRVSPPLGEWIQTDYLQCRERRRRTFSQIIMGIFPQPSGIPPDIWVPLRMALASMRKHSQDAIEAQKGEAEYKSFVAFDPDFAFDGRSPDDYNSLRALPKILTWSIFKHKAAKKFIGLVTERIPKSL